MDLQPLVAKVIDRDPVSVALEQLHLACSSVDFEQRWLPGIRSGDGSELALDDCLIAGLGLEGRVVTRPLREHQLRGHRVVDVDP